MPSIRWTVQTEGADGIAIGEDAVYVAGGERLVAHAISDGATLWSTEIPDLSGWVDWSEPLVVVQ